MKDNSKEIGNLSLFKKGMIIATATMTTFAAMSANKTIFAADSENTETKPVLQYNAHVENIGWQGSKIADILEGNSQIVSTVTLGTVGRSLRMEALTISLTGVPDASLKYNVHSQNKGWTGWKENGEVAGTVGESLRAEALKISVTGLNEAGYSLYYRVHVSDIGWMNWISADDSLNLTNYAGTVGRALRMEAIEIVLVKDISAEDELKAKIAEIIAELNKYDAALGTTTIGGSADDISKYNEIHGLIEAAKEEIAEAEKIEDVTEIFDDVMAKIRAKYPNADTLALKVAAEAAAKKEEIAEKMDIYKTKLQTSNLSESTKNVISQVIKKTQDAIDVAQTSTEVQEAYEEMVELLEIYPEYDLNVSKQMAVNELTELLDGANTGAVKTITEAIAQINSGKIDEQVITKDSLETLVNSTTTKVNGVKTKQKEAVKELDLYETAVEESTDISSATKAIIRNEIAEVREQVDNAKDATEVTNAMNNFETYMNTYYGNIVDKKAEVALEAKKQEAIKALNKYATCGYPSVEAKAKEFITKITKPEENSTTLQDELDDLEDNIATLEEAKLEAEADVELKLKQYNENYNAAIEELNKYDEILNNTEGLDLTDKEVNELKSLVENTRISVNATKETKDTDSMEVAMTMFESYIAKHYPDIEAEANANRLAKAKEDAIKKLNNYESSKVDGVSGIASAAITEIKALEDLDEIKDALNLATAQADAIIELAELDELYGKVTGVSNIINTAKNNIKNATSVKDIKDEDGNVTTQGVTSLLNDAKKSVNDAVEADATANALKNAKQNAIDQLKRFMDNSNANVVNIAKTAITAIANCTSIEDTKPADTTVPGVTSLLNKAKADIQKELGAIPDELVEAQKVTTETINNYKAMAKELGETKLINKLSLYENALTEAINNKDVERVEEINAEVINFVTANYPVLSTKVTKINELKNTYLNEENATYGKYVKYTQFTDIVNKAISDIKEQEVDNTTKITAIMTQFNTDIADVKATIDAYENAQTAAKAAIDTKTSTATTGKADNIVNAATTLAASYKNDIDNVSYAKYLAYEAKKTSEDDVTTVFTSMQAEAESMIDIICGTQAGN